ncbi:TetR/AcrR family transcriptional regulator [Chromobacterium piscinae]|uniref:TetR/AcrR family transcriptional regulator n=1 Tax=Chromobacterium piscinae TaxID=686831 RepID=UPI00140B402E|nr:TetR/AcrR family transcriptional regulator [Chromobacterium piscinae]MBX9297213.1 TetR/AcrR family transcriptional regulator [Chromobacterium vaccinii]MBX9359036.1 TetR/AcrR family transcriptional regulator [Chromobacterium vaccinii]MCD4503839.1 TetR/AcrR family transcriptional regulator [Chromobacterium piscinae]NHQ83310.1 TetR/AcrR family transcriptional regulator [Chromobacterium vaccinii]
MKSIPPTDIAALPARDRILATAHRLFYQEGLRATGIDRLIAESGVTKVTFYRHFPSKNDLIKAYLEQRHSLWMDWFKAALARRDSPAALADAMREWFASDDFRGCAFINGAGEMPAEPAVMDAARRHKAEMRQAIAERLPEGPGKAEMAEMLSLAADGAIVRAQLDGQADAALAALESLVGKLAG